MSYEFLALKLHRRRERQPVHTIPVDRSNISVFSRGVKGVFFYFPSSRASLNMSENINKDLAKRI